MNKNEKMNDLEKKKNDVQRENEVLFELREKITQELMKLKVNYSFII